MCWLQRLRGIGIPSPSTVRLCVCGWAQSKVFSCHSHRFRSKLKIDTTSSVCLFACLFQSVSINDLWTHSHRNRIWHFVFAWLILVKRFLYHRMCTNTICVIRQNGSRRKPFSATLKRYDNAFLFTLRFCVFKCFRKMEHTATTTTTKTQWIVLLTISDERQSDKFVGYRLQENLWCENQEHLRVSLWIVDLSQLYLSHKLTGVHVIFSVQEYVGGWIEHRHKRCWTGGEIFTIDS